MNFALAAALGAALLALAFYVFLRFGRGVGASRARGARPGGAGARSGAASASCPLCSSVLEPGERVKSDITPGSGDRIMRIFGCPRCLPPLGGLRRVCPVCLASLPPEGWVVARYFERPGRRHVHVLGCTGCRPGSG
ncbi:MAG TPA: hypothetical protein PLB91_00130 [Spirochaetales bacterium]|nr:hypothetical protein [Spirochaetales bacterium]HRY53943.1 hypothetical protein [Spirochaetia bacterium]HRZ64118.1 hypothetical protein [Spirochaetia bacterium]